MPLQECQFPNCRHISKQTWANISLCDYHYETIKSESQEYYMGAKKGVRYEDRYYYLHIAPMIPWSQFSLERKMS